MIFLLKAGGSRVLAFRIDGVRLVFPTSRAQQCEKLQNGVFQGGRVWASRFECGAVYGSCWFSDLRGVRFLDERRWVFRGFEAMKQSVWVSVEVSGYWVRTPRARRCEEGLWAEAQWSKVSGCKAPGSMKCTSNN